MRYTFEALAPIIFGWGTTLFGTTGGLFSESSQSAGSSVMPLTYTFRWMLIPVVIVATVLYFCKYYPRDVAKVLASENAEELLTVIKANTLRSAVYNSSVKVDNAKDHGTPSVVTEDGNETKILRLDFPRIC